MKRRVFRVVWDTWEINGEQSNQPFNAKRTITPGSSSSPGVCHISHGHLGQPQLFISWRGRLDRPICELAWEDAEPSQILPNKVSLFQNGPRQGMPHATPGVAETLTSVVSLWRGQCFMWLDVLGKRRVDQWSAASADMLNC